MVKATDPICTWCKKPDSRCICDAAANAFVEPANLKVSKTVPGVDALTFLMEILGLAMFLIGFTLFCGLIALAIFASRETNSPAFGAMISFIGFFSTLNALAIRAEEILTDHEPWVYRPVQHKGRHRGHVLEILIGPRARAAIKPFMQRVASGSLWRAKGEILHQTYRKAFGRACQAARIDTISPRQLRHTAASFLVNEGVSEAVIGSILGHRPTTITQRYAKIDDKVKAKVVEKYG